MEQKILKKYMKYGIISVCLLFCQTLSAMFWGENIETVRLALFRAELSNSSVFRPFSYSANLFNSNAPDPEHLDQQRNCNEWQTKIGKQVLTKDIAAILYNTQSEYFEMAYQEKRLLKAFPKNTFIAALVLPQNEALLKYISFAKRMEYAYTSNEQSWENWDNLNRYNKAQTPQIDPLIYTQLDTLSDKFLKVRYAFLIMRNSYQLAVDSLLLMRFYDISIKNTDSLVFMHYYDSYIEKVKQNSIINTWALLYKALYKQGAEGNYLYSLVFDRCHEKKFIVNMWFDKKPSMIAKTLKFAKNDHERGVIMAMRIINNPNPQLKDLQTIYQLLPESNYFSFLVGREINKLEDWLFTSKYTNYGASVDLPAREKWSSAQNRAKDMAYLGQLKAFLRAIYPQSKGEMRDFLAIAIAHLCFMEENIVEGEIYLAAISPQANASILNQKNIELALICLKKNNIQQEKTKNTLLKYFKRLEKIAHKEVDMYKSLYSLLRIVSKAYAQQNDFATAGLLFMKSEYYKKKYDDGKELYSEPFGDEENSYWHIGYFERNANIKDMDKLIFIREKKEKTSFERYMCQQKLASVYFYKDLKGMMAFRNNDLVLAHKTFLEIPDTFWQNQYSFKNYLNEDPFVPKYLSYFYARRFDFHFNKAEFLQELLCYQKEAELYPEKRATSYLQLGHAYYNCSFWGNAWMMAVYGQGGGLNGYFYYNQFHYETTFGSEEKKLTEICSGNYVSCSLAKKYYLLALQTAQNDEQKAMANLMLHICDYQVFLSENDSYGNAKRKPFMAGKNLKDFYEKYAHTAVFRQYSCPLLADFLK